MKLLRYLYERAQKNDVFSDWQRSVVRATIHLMNLHAHHEFEYVLLVCPNYSISYFRNIGKNSILLFVIEHI